MRVDERQNPFREERAHCSHRHLLGEQFRAARKYADEADARALEIELEEIGRLRASGSITKRQAHELRESVYLMQMTLGE